MTNEVKACVAGGLILAFAGGFFIGTRAAPQCEGLCLPKSAWQDEAHEVTQCLEDLSKAQEVIARLREVDGGWICDRYPCNQGDLAPNPRRSRQDPTEPAQPLPK